MANGFTTTINQIQNNKPSVTVSTTVTEIVNNSKLAIDDNDLNPGVNTKNF